VRERIDEAAWPTAKRAAQPEIGLRFHAKVRLRKRRDRNWHLHRFSTAEWCRRNDRRGTLIRHAGGRVALAVGTLPVAMIEPTLRTALVAAVSGAVLAAPGFAPASWAAIALAAIAVRANPEHRLASLAATHSRPENRFSMNRHPPTPAGFDNGNGSCQRRTSFDWSPSHEGCQARTPLLGTAGFSTAFHSHNTMFGWNVLGLDD
jgi:hypothetical protein